jgi:hypothetical protein
MVSGSGRGDNRLVMKEKAENRVEWAHQDLAAPEPDAYDLPTSLSMLSFHEPEPIAPQADGELRDLFAAVYEALRRIAHRQLEGEATGHTLGTTGLVHEAYLELARRDHIRWPGRANVLAAAAQSIRRILVDYAVARRAQ